MSFESVIVNALTKNVSVSLCHQQAFGLHVMYMKFLSNYCVQFIAHDNVERYGLFGIRLIEKYFDFAFARFSIG